MNLVHIYIGEHKAIRNLNISFGGGVLCSVQERTIKISRLTDTSAYYHGFHCSALIGANGVGKSSALDFIETAYFPTDSSGTLIFYEAKTEIFHICVINMEITICNKQHEIHYDYNHFATTHSVNIVKINNISSAQNKLGYQKKHIHPLIHEHTLEEYTKSKIKQKQYFANLLAYFRGSVQRDGIVKDIGFEFTFNNSCSRVDRLFLESTFHIDHSKTISNLKEKFISKNSHPEWMTLGPNEIFQSLIKLNSISIIVELSASRKMSDKRYLLAFLLKTYIEIDVSERYTNNTIALKQTIEALRYLENWNIFSIPPSELENIQDVVDIERMQLRLESIIELLERIASLLSNYQFEFKNTDPASVKIEDFYIISELTNIIVKLPPSISSNFSWGWRGVSTGEMALSHLFSETYHYLRSAPKKRNSIFIIDEADLYLHPEWQRSFLDTYLSHLKMLVDSASIFKPQILLSTHSPIIISDFLPQDITSLTKDANGQVSLRESMGFGTNITNLFIDGMHIDSTFGEHSRKAISTLIKKSQEGKLEKLDRVLIGSMGNKFIKEYLLENDNV
ncbi:AAA family ATPase [Pseudomonas rossensis]|uniref:AAA family ATPase n=1 Tax=Pseudomonas rossensis TaxID=2305471 RepID=UPI003261BC84